MNKWRPIIVSTIIVLILCVGNGAMGETVTGYSSYVRLLPGGTDRQESNFELITAAQEDVRIQEAEKRKREIKFDRPVDIHFLNATYTMVSFEVFFRPMENSRFSTHPAIFALLFEGTGRNGLARYTSRYIKWIGQVDIEEYQSSQIKDFCDYFRRAGVEDCIPEKGDGKASEASRNTAVPGLTQAINGNMISAGMVKDAFIDPAISRKKDVDALLEKNALVVDSLSTELKTIQGRTDDMALQIQGVDQKVTDLASAVAEDVQARAEKAVAQDSDALTVLAEKLQRQSEQIQALNEQMNNIHALLEGLSRTRNTLLLTGANLQIVNGTGVSVGHDTGTGNLILGYNEKKPGETLQPGSHQVILPGGGTMDRSADTQPEDSTGKGFGGRCFIESLWE